MSFGLTLWTVLGAIYLLIAGLFVTILARGMEKRAAKPAAVEGKGDDDAKDDSFAALAKFTPEGLLGNALRKHVFASKKDLEAEVAMANEKARKKGGVAAGIIGAVVAISVGGGIVSEIVDDIKSSAGLNAMPTNQEISAGVLRGTLLSPKKNAPVVLIIPGSGPTDRDGNSPLGVKAQPYKLLAEALFEDGIASVRVDKRGMFGSAAAGDPSAVSIAAYTDDYHAWIDAIRAETGRKCVFLLGHSEGALMASAAAQGRDDVCGLILVSGMGRKFGDVLREQLKANPANAPVLESALTAISELEAGRHVDTSTMHPALMQLFAPRVQDFLISEMAVDPVDVLAQAKKKSLIIQGTTDIQVSVADARLLDKARNAKLRVITGMNHVLKEAPEDRAANLATYTNADLPLHPKLEREIRRFIKDDD